MFRYPSEYSTIELQPSHHHTTCLLWISSILAKPEIGRILSQRCDNVVPALAQWRANDFPACLSYPCRTCTMNNLPLDSRRLLPGDANYTSHYPAQMAASIRKVDAAEGARLQNWERDAAQPRASSANVQPMHVCCCQSMGCIQRGLMSHRLGPLKEEKSRTKVAEPSSDSKVN